MKYLKDCIDTGWVSSVGRYVKLFEKRIAEYVGTRFAVATVNGTSALHLSLLACGVKANDEIVVPTLTFIAPVNAVSYCNAYPVFMDCDRETLCIDVNKLTDFIKKECRRDKDGYTYNKKTKRRIKAVIPVHIFGHPADMDGLFLVCKKNNIQIIEDATESLGSVYKGRKAGTMGAAGCFSFNGNKIITSGGGGMVVTDNELLSGRIRHLGTQAKKDNFEYFHDEVGYNYRLSNLQAAVGVAQMERLKDFLRIKRENAQIYKELLSNIRGAELLWEKPWAKSNFWLYALKVPRKHKKSLMQFLLTRRIQVRPIWKLMQDLPMYEKYQAYQVNEAKEAYNTCINLPSSVSLTFKEICFICDAIAAYFRKARL